MKKLSEETRKYIYVDEIEVVFRTSDGIPYSVYKNEDGRYYMDAADGAYSITPISDPFGGFGSDQEAIKWVQDFLDDIDE